MYKKIILILLVFTLLPFVEGSHQSYTGTDFNICHDKCMLEHEEKLDVFYACQNTCDNIVSGNKDDISNDEYDRIVNNCLNQLNAAGRFKYWLEGDEVVCEGEDTTNADCFNPWDSCMAAAGAGQSSGGSTGFSSGKSAAQLEKERIAREKQAEQKRIYNIFQVKYDEINQFLLRPVEISCGSINDKFVDVTINELRNSKELIRGGTIVKYNLAANEMDFYRIKVKDNQLKCYLYERTTSAERFQRLDHTWRVNEARRLGLPAGSLPKEVPCPQEAIVEANKISKGAVLKHFKVREREIKIRRINGGTPMCYGFVSLTPKIFEEDVKDIIPCDDYNIQEEIKKWNKLRYGKGDQLVSKWIADIEGTVWRENYKMYLREEGAYCFSQGISMKVSYGPKSSSKFRSVVPVPDLTQKQIDFINSETKAEEERIERLRNPTFLDDLYDSFQTSVVLADIDFEWAPGLNVQVSTSPEKVAVWGTEVVINPAREQAKGKITSFVLTPEAQELISNTLTVTSLNQAWYEIKQPPKEELKLSGVYIKGPFKIRITYAPESIPRGYSEEDLGMFHAVVKGGKVTFSKVRNIMVDTESNTITGVVDDFSIFTVGILEEEKTLQDEETSSSISPDEETPPPAAGLAIMFIVLFLATVAGMRVHGHFIRKKVGKHKTEMWGKWSFVWGIVGIVAFLIPYIGLPFSLAAIYFSREQKKYKNTKSSKRGMILGIIGIVINTLFLIVTFASIA